MSLLAELIQRDGEACVWCARELWRVDLTVEHLLPRARGGRGTLENLAVACRRCNRARGAQAVSSYVRSLLQAGAQPQMATLETALARLARSPRSVHAAYGVRQLALLAQVQASAAHLPVG